MKVAIDFREAAQSSRAGKGEHVYQLTRALISVSPDVQFVLLTHVGQKIDLPEGRWIQRSFMGGPILWHLVVLMWLEFMSPVDVYFASTSVIVPALLRSVPSITTLFDFTAWRYPVTHLPRAVVLEHLFMAAAIKFSKKLLAISNFTKQEAVSLFGVSPDKIVVTLLAAENSYKPLELSNQQTIALRQKYSLPNRFILYLGTIEPRKNIQFLIRAYQSIKPRIPDVKLVLVGNKGWYAGQILDLVGGDVVTTGYVDKEDKPALYNLADIFVFPSLYEGFGLPPLEAMACGTPTIVSDRASLPEVVNGGAKVVSIEKIEELAETMLKLLQSPDERHELHQHGIDQSKKFSWEQTARQTREVLRLYE